MTYNISCFFKYCVHLCSPEPKFNDLIFYPLQMVPRQIIGLNGCTVLC